MTKGVTSGGEETPISIVRPCGMGVLLSRVSLR